MRPGPGNVSSPCVPQPAHRPLDLRTLPPLAPDAHADAGANADLISLSWYQRRGMRSTESAGRLHCYRWPLSGEALRMASADTGRLGLRGVRCILLDVARTDTGHAGETLISTPAHALARGSYRKMSFDYMEKQLDIAYIKTAQRVLGAGQDVRWMGGRRLRCLRNGRWTSSAGDNVVVLRPISRH